MWHLICYFVFRFHIFLQSNHSRLCSAGTRPVCMLPMLQTAVFQTAVMELSIFIIAGIQADVFIVLLLEGKVRVPVEWTPLPRFYVPTVKMSMSSFSTTFVGTFIWGWAVRLFLNSSPGVRHERNWLGLVTIAPCWRVSRDRHAIMWYQLHCVIVYISIDSYLQTFTFH